MSVLQIRVAQTKPVVWTDLLARWMEGPVIHSSWVPFRAQRKEVGAGVFHSCPWPPERCFHPGTGDFRVYRLVQVLSVGGQGVQMATFPDLGWPPHKISPGTGSGRILCVEYLFLGFEAPHKAELFLASHPFFSRCFPCSPCLAADSTWTRIPSNSPYKV